MLKRKQYTLRVTIGLLVLSSVILTAFVTGYSAVKAMKNSLTLTYLQNNEQYARKLSSETNNLIVTMQENINSIANKAKEHNFNQKELDFLLKSNKQYYNSIFIVDSTRRIKRVSPSMPNIQEGTQLNSAQSIKASELKKPFISEPYVATSKRLILMISSPIFSETGDYKGFVGGTIYLEEENALGNTLKEHFHGNGSYVYVVDSKGRIIFHPDKNRINETVRNNKVVNKVIRGQSGVEVIKNSKGIEYNVGYTYESITGWGIISQTPVSEINKPLYKLILHMILLAVPSILIILLITLCLSVYISKPLSKLAKLSEGAYLQNNTHFTTPNTSSIIYEVRQLYFHFNNHIKHLQAEIQMDGLTNLANRKAFDHVIQEWIDLKQEFSLILLDIDHFKMINDSFGHLAGDQVLKHVASIIRTCSREIDLCFRYGGEEFGILVKFADDSKAFMLAERLRTELKNNISPTGEVITISGGIATSQDKFQTPNDLIRLADIALYHSKVSGRNKTTVYKETNNMKMQ